VATDRRPQMRLMAHDLLGSDLALLAAFLRVGRDHLDASWALVFDGEADVVLIGRVNARTVPGLLDLPLAVAQVVDAGPRRPGFLSRPLDYRPARHRAGRRFSVDAADRPATAWRTVRAITGPARHVPAGATSP